MVMMMMMDVVVGRVLLFSPVPVLPARFQVCAIFTAGVKDERGP